MPCTDDACVPGTGCVNSNDNTNTCSNGDADLCTTGDTCVAGACVAGTTAVVCNDGKACTDDLCNPLTGCVATPDDGNTCSDSNACTVGDSCSAGNCVAGTGALTCDDGKACTDDACDPASGCVATNDNSNTCSDGTLCTVGDACVAGACVPGAAPNCDDGKVCTDDSCDALIGCVNQNDNSNSCTDNNACTVGDGCSAGNCVAGAGPLTCDDGLPCTDDSCVPATGCAFATDNSNICSDGLLTTSGDACVGGICSGTPIVCPTPNQCQDAVPNGTTCTLVAKAANTPCDDGSTATANDTCTASVCSGTTIVCAAPTQCQATVTPNGSDCTTTFKANTASCDDGLATTSGDTCNGQGTCLGTTIVCAAPTQCETAGVPNGTSCPKGFKANTVACNDSLATTSGDRCDGQGGCAGVTILCPAPTQCQTAGVPDGTTCTPGNRPSTATCDDGVPATLNDRCDGQGTCVGSAIQCPADTQCGTYAPNGVDCTFTPRTGACDDALATTHTDVCVDGLCKGKPYACAPTQCELTSVANGLDCTTVDKPADAPCNDGVATTKDDRCDGSGGCVGTAYTCALRTCEATSVADGIGCVATPAMPGVACDDLDPCTSNDQCDGARACVGEGIECGLGESCDPAGDCQLTHCTACADSVECGEGSECLAAGSDDRCLLSCSRDEDCGPGEVCRRHGEGTLRCFDADGPCAAPVIDPDTNPEVVEEAGEVEVVEVGPEEVEPEPEVVEPEPEVEGGPEQVEADEWRPEAVELVDIVSPPDAEVEEAEVVVKKSDDGCAGGAGSGGLLGVMLVGLLIALVRRQEA